MNAPDQNKTVSVPAQPEYAPDKSGKRRVLLIIITLIVLIALAAYGTWWYTVGRNFEHTEDAYAAGNVVQVTSQVAGTVVAIHADDTDVVQTGKPLVELDKTDAKVAVDQAEAQLAQTVREVRVLFANNGSLQANVSLRSSEVERAKSDLARRTQLLSTGAVSSEELEHARNAVKSAEAALQAASEQLTSNRTLTENTTVTQHPNVLRAAARVRETLLALSRTSLPAPMNGFVAKRAVQVGQRIAPGSPLLSIVPLNTLWVDANFKEVQLAHMRIGQEVELHSDLYGTDVTYHGKVLGMSAGTGSAFALLPAQNASGNWIKVVQRVPVRISLDPKELEAHPLRIGVSMQVQVNISQQQGAPVTAAARTTPAYQTAVFEQNGKDADQRIAEIIAANLPGTKDHKVDHKDDHKENHSAAAVKTTGKGA
ncbi:multidrug resistance protein A [Undibacterium sp. YM2]|uniref:HlyD family secretion protein n=1 Tax=Undibacterium sp. YM2 TaxID=2058625 RepID=UPI001331CDE0|nr:HlyD family efflux transporter periplasmic adaptor subunit [Undibacterium sp. YM2]BBB68778.1 multidrug resistance protein A [Undibacterium sp. YM2]